MPKDKKQTPAESLRATIRSSWDAASKKAKSKEMREFTEKKKAKVSKGGYEEEGSD